MRHETRVAPTPTGPNDDTPFSVAHARCAGPPSDPGACALAGDAKPRLKAITRATGAVLIVIHPSLDVAPESSVRFPKRQA